MEGYVRLTMFIGMACLYLFPLVCDFHSKGMKSLSFFFADTTEKNKDLKQEKKLPLEYHHSS